MHCIQCGSTDYRKNGKVKGKQRYRCVGCGYNFTNMHGRGKPPALRLQALRSRFNRRTKRYSKSVDMVTLSLYLLIQQKLS